MYQNYIFDLYGTLIDIHTDESSKNFYKKYVKWLRKQRYYFDWKQFRSSFLRIEQQYRSQLSKHHNPEIQIEDVFRDVFREKGYELDAEEILWLCESFRRISLIYLRLFPDTLQCLDALKKAGKHIYLLSNAQRSYTWQELEISGILPFFDGVLISSDEGCMKPDTDFYDILCERYHLDKKESVMIGNELRSDMAGAKAAGIDGFYLNRLAVFHEPEQADYRYVSKNGSLMEVLIQTGVIEHVGQG